MIWSFEKDFFFSDEGQLAIQPEKECKLPRSFLKVQSVDDKLDQESYILV